MEIPQCGGDYFKLLANNKDSCILTARIPYMWFDKHNGDLDDWLTVQHRSITLVDLQLDAQNSYLFTY